MLQVGKAAQRSGSSVLSNATCFKSAKPPNAVAPQHSATPHASSRQSRPTQWLLSTQQRHMLQVGKAAQRSGSSALSTLHQHFAIYKIGAVNLHRLNN